ncbi:MAG: glycosyl hydrolase family 18 protein [Streptosporangiaceae bacterium]
MPLPHLRTALALATAAALAAATWATTAQATAAPSRPAAPADYAPIPAQVYAPYFETYLAKSNIATVAKASGARYLTLAFIQTPQKGSCVATWNGDAKLPLSAGHYLGEIAALRATGGDVIPSFGGYSADQGGTEIADSCTSVSKIAAVYEMLVSKYHVTRLDMDVEAKSLNNTAGITRRSEAIAMAQAWAAARGITLQVDFTIPVEPYGLDPNGLNVLKSAIAHGVHIDVVNIMTFDYYETHEGRVDMPAAAMSAALNVHNQLAGLLPSDTARQLWAMEGMTLLPGVDDRGKIETTWLSGALQLRKFAAAQHMSLLSIWAIQRDNGGCPGTFDSNTCSGVKQQPWAYSHRLEPFTR